MSEKFISNRDNTVKGLNPGVMLKVSGALSSYSGLRTLTRMIMLHLLGDNIGAIYTRKNETRLS